MSQLISFTVPNNLVAQWTGEIYKVYLATIT